MKRIKQVYKISKKCNKKSCHLVPKVVIDLPFEGRKVEGSRKYRGRERVPKVGSRREETITEPINSRIGEFHTIVCTEIKIYTSNSFLYSAFYNFMYTFKGFSKIHQPFPDL